MTREEAILCLEENIGMLDCHQRVKDAINTLLSTAKVFELQGLDEAPKKHIDDIAEDHSEAYERINREMDERQKWRDGHPKEYAKQLEDAVKEYERLAEAPKKKLRKVCNLREDLKDEPIVRTEKTFDNDIKYIRKDALLEWVKEKEQKAITNIVKITYRTVIDKIESL